MRLGGRLAAAIEVLSDMEKRHRPAADALKDWGLSHRFAGSGDRAAIAGLLNLSLNDIARFDVAPASISTVHLWPAGGRVVGINEVVPASSVRNAIALNSAVFQAGTPVLSSGASGKPAILPGGKAAR